VLIGNTVLFALAASSFILIAVVPGRFFQQGVRGNGVACGIEQVVKA
jgi:hypothetical protein